MPQQNIVVIGASYSGISAAHYLLQNVIHTIPGGQYHLVLVNPSKELYHRISAPRSIVSTQLLPEHKTFLDIPSGFQRYTADEFTFVQGKATKVEPDSKQVIVELANGQTQTVQYQALIIATGASSADYLLSSHDTDGTESHQALAKIRQQLETAKSVVIGGGGPSGVEIAGEIAEYYNGKPGWFFNPVIKLRLQLFTSGDRLVPILRPAIGKQVESMLAGMGVETTYQTKVTGTELLPSGMTKVHLSNGKSIETDVYINTTGLRPMTGYLPKAWLNDKEQVNNNKETLRVDVAGPLIFAIGDVGAHTRGGAIDIDESIAVMGTNLKTDLLAAAGTKPQFQDRIFHGNVSETLGLVIGQSRAIGAFNGWIVPGILIWWVKGRDYLSGEFKDMVEGKRAAEKPYKPVPLAA